MFAATLIVFRETLEAALIVAIIMAATRGVAKRGRWISLGIASGVAGASLVALLTNVIADMFEGTGQELMNAGILFTAVAMLAWHVVWMSRHGRAMAAEMRAVGHSVSSGTKHLSVLALVIGLAVMREGSEVVLMLQGLLVGSGAHHAMLLGGALGLVAGVMAGGVIYTGFLALPVQRVFTLTNMLLMLIAAGMAARGVNFLVQAGWMPDLGSQMWDTSAVVSDQGLFGQALAALTGYIARPSGVQLLAYGATLLTLMLLLALQRKDGLRRVAVIGYVAIATLGIAFCWPHLAQAEIFQHLLAR